MYRITEGELEKQRLEMLGRRRRVILNNDGCDVMYFPSNKAITPKNLLELRTKPLVGSHVDTLFYCTISSGFGCFTQSSAIGAAFLQVFCSIHSPFTLPLRMCKIEIEKHDHARHARRHRHRPTSGPAA